MMRLRLEYWELAHSRLSSLQSAARAAWVEADLQHPTVPRPQEPKADKYGPVPLQTQDRGALHLQGAHLVCIMVSINQCKVWHFGWLTSAGGSRASRGSS